MKDDSTASLKPFQKASLKALLMEELIMVNPMSNHKMEMMMEVANLTYQTKMELQKVGEMDISKDHSKAVLKSIRKVQLKVPLMEELIFSPMRKHEIEMTMKLIRMTYQ